MLFASHRLKRLLLAGLLPILAATPANAFTFGQKDDGAAAHPLVLARFGGVYSSPGVASVVERVATRLVRADPGSKTHWTVSILDTPDIGAFAHPGGFIYLNRGLLAFADSEAELAAALAMQMAHVAIGNVEAGLSDRAGAEPPAPGALLDGLIGGEVGVIPELASDMVVSRPVLNAEHQRAAAKHAVAMLKRAGFPAIAALTLAERAEARAALGGASAASGEVTLFGDTADIRSATLDTLRKAVGRTTLMNQDHGREAYLVSLQGMTYGPSERHGFVAGTTYIHPELGVTFTAPDGFTLTHSATEVVASGPNGARLVLDTTGDAGSRLQSYLRDTWAPDLTRKMQAGYLYDLNATRIGGVEAALAFQPYEDEHGAKIAQLAVLRTAERDFRFRAVAPVEAFEVSMAMEAAIKSFRRLSSAEIAQFRPHWVQIHRITEGDTVNLLAATLPERAAAEERFRLLNGYGPQDIPKRGDLVKLVMQEH